MKKRGRIKFHRVKTWQLLVILVPLLFIDATLLRANHVQMTELRDAVIAADAAEESDEVIAEKLAALKDYTLNNIVINVVDDNGEQRVTFGTGPFYLEHTYIRAANKALAEAEAKFTDDSNPNGNIYGMASEICRVQAIANGWSWDDANYINCMMSEIQKYPAADEIQDKIVASLPSTELYRWEFVAPVWAPTLTGWMILITLVIIVVILIRGLVWVILRISLLFV
ncbi:hypothetical protein IKG05_02235 [Candidatus Saccharibacteria bacterium]|nr:hypothetical protein [Candidatus Saccharibacteria bacterium]